MAYSNPVPSLPSNTASEAVLPKNIDYQPNYVRCDNMYFAFLDILGFKQAFDENRKEENGPFANKYATVFKYYSLLLSNARIMSSEYTKAGQTSDSLYFYTERSDHLAEFIRIYLHFSLYSMSKDVFFRGGIAKGSLFINTPHQFYGDCVIKAYLLENKIAKFPCIAFDRDTYQALNTECDLKNAFCENGGRYYLKPFVHIDKNELANITQLDTSQIKNIKESEVRKSITDGLRRFEFDEQIYPKYHFLFEEITTQRDLFK